MKLTKEFIKNEIKRLLNEVHQDQEWPPEGTPSAEAPTAPEAAGTCKMPCKTAADCKKTTGQAKLEPRYSMIGRAIAEPLPLPGETTSTVKEARVEQEWDCVKNCCVPVQQMAIASSPAPTPEETKQFYGCYDRLWKVNPKMMQALEDGFSVVGGSLGAPAVACLESAACREEVFKACKQAAPAPAPKPCTNDTHCEPNEDEYCVKGKCVYESPVGAPNKNCAAECVDEILVRPTGTNACPPSHKFRGNTKDGMMRCCRAIAGTQPPEGPIWDPQNKKCVKECPKGTKMTNTPDGPACKRPKKGGLRDGKAGKGGCGRRWISISSSYRQYEHIKVCVLLPSKARRIQGGFTKQPPPEGTENACRKECEDEAMLGKNVFDPCMAACKKTYRSSVDRLWDTDPESSDNDAFAEQAFKAIDPMLTATGYIMTESGGYELEKAAGRNVFVAYYDLNPDLVGDREARREARKVRRQISRNRKDMWYDIYNKAKDSLVSGTAGEATRAQEFAATRAAKLPQGARAALNLAPIRGLGGQGKRDINEDLREAKTIRIRKKNK